MLGAKAVGAAAEGHGPVTLTCARADGVPFDLHAETILVATGRRPDVERLHLERAGVALDDHGNLPVDEHLRVRGTENIYAIGDASGQPSVYTGGRISGPGGGTQYPAPG